MRDFSSLRERERKNRIDLILDAAERIFSKTPFTDISMRQIAEEAGCSPASIYRYFNDQEMLFMEAYMRRSKDLLKDLQTIINECSEGILERVAFHYADYHMQRIIYFEMMVHFMLHYSLKNPESLRKLNTMERAMVDVFETAIAKSKVTGNTRYLAHMFFGSLNGVLITFHKYPGRTEEQVTNHIKRLISILCGLIDSISTNRTDYRRMANNRQTSRS
jgi:AcrR family transcriptional regulator